MCTVRLLAEGLEVCAHHLLAALANVSAGDTLTIGTGQRMEQAVVASMGTAGPEGTGVTLTAPLTLPHTSGIDVWSRGTGISFRPATRFAHRSGDAVQALGSGVVLDRPLTCGGHDDSPSTCCRASRGSHKRRGDRQ